MPYNPESILDSLKKVAGVDYSNTDFDTDMLMHINAIFSDLQQLDVGPFGFSISDNTTLWSDYLTEPILLGPVKSFIHLKVRLIFDTPGLSFVIEALQSQAAEFAWRINVLAESFVNLPWWDITGTLDFPVQAKAGDLGIDFDSGNVWLDRADPYHRLLRRDDLGYRNFVEDELAIDAGTGSTVPVGFDKAHGGYMWNVTGLSDFPPDALINDLGLDMSTGDVWRKTG
jgi:hypothetical protein